MRLPPKLRTPWLWSGLLALSLVPAAALAEYRFVFLSHMGPHDSNAKWFELSLGTFQEKFPDVTIEYRTPGKYSNEKFNEMIEQAIADKPDGIAVSVIDAPAIEETLRKAIDQGIPVIAFNTADPRPAGERIPYLAYVGTDSYLDGLRAAEHALAQADAGAAPMPTRVLCVNPDAGHAGLEARCKGMADGMTERLVVTDTVYTDLDPVRAAEILTEYLQSHQDINYLYAVTADSGPVVWKVARDLELGPDADLEGVTIMGVDDSPLSLSGVAQGRLLSTMSQGFWLQGWEPASWLYWYQQYGYQPGGDILTGPVIIDKSTVAQWEGFVRGIFGDEAYKQASWPASP